MSASTTPATIIWLRRDLRLADHPALAEAVRRGGPVIPVFIWAPEEEAPWEPGAASRWWLHQSLAALGQALRGIGSRLVLRQGPSAVTLRALVRETGADAVLWTRRHEPSAVRRDAAVARALRDVGVLGQACGGALLWEPDTVATKSGRPYQVFTPFARACAGGVPVDPPIPPPARLHAPPAWPVSLTLSSLALEPAVDWTDGLRAAWRPGPAGAAEQLGAFLMDAIPRYAAARDRPGIAGTARLSPHLAFGEISPRQLWRAAEAVARQDTRPGAARAAEAWQRQLVWREFAYHLLWHFPHTPDTPLRESFRHFPWREDAEALRAWQRGRTGFPIVDAAMHELWTTGWMHGRTRMIAASFLVKDLLVPWQHGARWFWDTLVDADLASNTLNWQWVAGCGADAAPFFRVFNPVTQGRKFDADGSYVRLHLPVLAGLPDAVLHEPWEASALDLMAARLELGRGYPPPMVDHAVARARALAALAAARIRER